MQILFAARRNKGWPNRIKNRKSGNQPKFRFRLNINQNDISKFRFRSIRNRIGKLKIRFRLIRTKILLSKSGSGFLRPHSGRPLSQASSQIWEPPKSKIFWNVPCWLFLSIYVGYPPFCALKSENSLKWPPMTLKKIFQIFSLNPGVIVGQRIHWW